MLSGVPVCMFLLLVVALVMVLVHIRLSSGEEASDIFFLLMDIEGY